MKNLLKLVSLIPDTLKPKLFYVQFFIILISLLELSAVLLVYPLLNLILDQNIENKWYLYISKIFQIHNYENVIIYTGLAFVITLSISNILRAFLVYIYLEFCESVGAKITTNLYRLYIQKEYSFIVKTNTSELVNNFMLDVPRMISQVLIPILQINSQIIVAILLFASLIYLSPIAALSSFLFIGFLYFVTILYTRRILNKNSSDLTNLSERRLAILKEGFGLFKWLKVSNKENIFYSEFYKVINKIHRILLLNSALSLIPRYILEFVAVIGITIISIILYSFSNNFISIMPEIAIFGVAGLKLMPSLQQIYNGISRYNANFTVVSKLYPTIISANSYLENKKNNYPTIDIKEFIEFKKISFGYQNGENILKNVSIKIEKGTSNAIVGPSGSGKTTFIDLLLGINIPQNGEISIDNKNIEKIKYQLSSKKITFVPQVNYILNASLVHNISFGEKVNIERIKEVLKLVDLWEHIQTNCPEGINTIIGEDGINFSGGQRQKIGLARSLYTGTSFLIMDESTNSIDKLSKAKIMNNLKSIRDFTLIEISHDETNYDYYDNVFKIDNGMIKKIN
jgi:HlyD family secretion protein